jgi:hypothetical protein
MNQSPQVIQFQCVAEVLKYETRTLGGQFREMFPDDMDRHYVRMTLVLKENAERVVRRCRLSLVTHNGPPGYNDAEKLPAIPTSQPGGVGTGAIPG